MERKIVIRPERKLTNDEIERLTKKFLFLTTKITETQGESSPGYYDRFAGVRIPSRTIKKPEVIGVCDYFSYLKSEVSEKPGYEYEVTIDEAQFEQPIYLERVKKYSTFGLNEEQLNSIVNTKLADFFKGINTVEKIKERHKEARRRTSWDSEYEFDKSEQEKDFLKQVFDELSILGLRGKSQVEDMRDNSIKKGIVKLNDDPSRELIGVVRVDDIYEYKLMEFPLRVSFMFDGNNLKFSSFEKVIPEKEYGTEQEFYDKISKTHTLLGINPEFDEKNRNYYSFIFPELIHDSEQCEQIIEQMKNVEIDNIDNIEDLSIDETSNLLKSNFEKYFNIVVNSYDADDILKRIQDISDNKLKKKTMEIFLQNVTNYTESQIKNIKDILTELLKDEEGWYDNTEHISGFGKCLMDNLSFSEKKDFLQMCINSNNKYWEKYWEKPMKNSEDPDEYVEMIKENQIGMHLAPLINNLFSEEEKNKLAEELIKEKNYQAMIMILKESNYYDIYSIERVEVELPKEKKDAMANAILSDKDNVKREWPKYKVPYIDKFITHLKINAFKQISGEDPFYMVKTSVINDLGEETFSEYIKCFEDRKYSTVAYLDIEKAKEKIENGELSIKVPKAYYGWMFGKEHKNIQRIEEEFAKLSNQKIKIRLKPRELGSTITLQKINDALEAQKAQSHVD